jgi:Xaa-Pro aminopeptidase
MKSNFPAASLFTLNRDRLRRLLPKNALVVLNSNDILPTNADGSLALVQNADLFYLTGIRQEESMLVLAPDAFDESLREVLYLRQPNELMVTWEGHKLSKEQATAISGIKDVRWFSEFPAAFRTLMCESENIFLNTNEHNRAHPEVETRDARFVKQVRDKYPLHQYHRLARLMHQLRVVKSPLEIEAIREASRITGKGFRRVLKFLKSGVNEKEVEAEFAHEFIRNHAEFAYNPIVAGGANNCILHYTTNDLECRKGDLLLLDVAAAIHGYNSDLTRTIPVSGKFSRRQKQVYNAVLRIFRHQCAAMKPGRTILDLRKECEEITAKECVDLGLLKLSEIKKQSPSNPAVRKFFMHGVSHPIGLDVHDVLYPSQKIQPGWVLTCEPGIYIKTEGFGVRLENDIHVTPNGPEDLMADIPIEADEIESLMKR